MNISPAAVSSADAAMGGQGIELSSDGGKTWSTTLTLLFTSSSQAPKVIQVRAASGAINTNPNTETLAIATSIVAVGGDDVAKLDAMILPIVKVFVENSASGLIVDQTAASTTIIAGQTTYNYNISLNRQPNPGETVTVTVASSNSRVTLSGGTSNGAGGETFTFTSGDWNRSQVVTVGATSLDAANAVGAIVTNTLTTTGGNLTNTQTGDTSGNVPVVIAASGTAGIQVIKPQGEAVVSPTVPYTYQLALIPTASGPTAPVTVVINDDGQTIASSQDGRFHAAAGSNPAYVVFTPTDYSPVSITLSVNPNYVSSGSGTGNTVTTTYTFAAQSHTLSAIAGPLYIEGGDGPIDYSLRVPVVLPGEVNLPFIPIAAVADSGAIDHLQVYDDGTSAAVSQIGSIATDLSSTGIGYTKISGLDIGTTINDGTTSFIDFKDLNTVQLLLGPANDTLSINTPATPLTDTNGIDTTIIVAGGGGSNTITVTHSANPLVLYGNESADGTEYSSNPTIAGNNSSGHVTNAVDEGYAFSNFGTDTINASGATGTVVIVGGPNHDVLTGGTGVNWIAGGLGADTIVGQGTKDYIFGDSSFDVDPTTHILTISNATTGPGGAIAGADTITEGSGNAVIFGDFGIVLNTNATNPAQLLPFGTEVIAEIASVNYASGGNDVIQAGSGNDIVFGGAGDDMITLGTGLLIAFGDNGELDYNSNEVLVSAKSLVGGDGNDTIEGATLNGVVQPAGSGNAIVIGGGGGDTIDLGGSGNTIIGDEGYATFDATGALVSAGTDPFNSTIGGADMITVSAGGNVIFGGAGDDTITVLSTGSATTGNIIVGDDGNAHFNAGVLATQTNGSPALETTDQTVAGNDTITINGDGNNVVLGGSGADKITINGNGRNVVFGDNGALGYTNGVLTSAQTIGEVSYGAQLCIQFRHLQLSVRRIE